MKRNAPIYHRYYTFTVFIVIIILNWADQNIFSPKLNALLEDFNMLRTAPLGLISSLFMVTTAVGMVVFGYISDKMKRKWLTVGAAFFYSIFTFLTSFTPDGRQGYYYLFTLRLISGFGLGAVVPAIFSMIGDMARQDKRGSVMSFFTVATVLGQLGGLALASSLEDWRSAYLYIGIAEIVLAGFLIFIQEPKRGASEEEIQDILVEGSEYQFTFKKEDWKLLWRNKSNRWIILNFVDTIPSSMLIFVIFKYFEDFHNITEDKTTLFLGFGIVGGIFGAIIFGYLGDKYFQKNKKARAILAIICNNVPVIFYCLLFIPFVGNFQASPTDEFGDLLQYGPIQFIVAVVFITMLINQGVGPNWYSSVLDVNLPEHRGTMISIASFADLFGKALGPFLGGLIMDWLDPRAAMIAVAIFWVSNSLFWIPVYKNIDKDINRMDDILEKRKKDLISKE